MHLAAVFPTMDIGNDPVAVRDWAQAAEGLGYRRIVAYDHVLGVVHAGRPKPLWGPYDETTGFHEPLVLLGYLAGVTSSIELMTGLLILPQRQTVLAAKQAAEVFILSGGRLVLGVGIGWNYVEYEALSVPWERRTERFEEQIRVLRQLWKEPVLNWRSQFHRIDRGGILPRPDGDIPLWCGGFVDSALQRAARFGDGFLFAAPGPETIAQAERLRIYLMDEGRDQAVFGIQVITSYSLGPTRWAEDFSAWSKVGATHFSVRSFDSSAAQLGVPRAELTSVDDHIGALRRFAEELS
jgi:probable F420-dependent oxidoreductase